MPVQTWPGLSEDGKVGLLCREPSSFGKHVPVTEHALPLNGRTRPKRRSPSAGLPWVTETTWDDRFATDARIVQRFPSIVIDFTENVIGG